MFLIKTVECLKKFFGVKTWVIENAFVFIVLSITNIIFGQTYDLLSWVTVFAVYFSFDHASVSQRLEEQEHRKKVLREPIYIECYHKLKSRFILKEILWLVTFLYLGAYAALAGVFIFLSYYPWRKLWRKYHPV